MRNELEMAVIFVSTGVSAELMVDKMMKVAPGGLVVQLLPKQTQLQVQNPRLDVDFGVFIALRDKKKPQKYRCGYEGYPKIILPYKPGFLFSNPKKVFLFKKLPKNRYVFMEQIGVLPPYGKCRKTPTAEYTPTAEFSYHGRWAWVIKFYICERESRMELRLQLQQ